MKIAAIGDLHVTEARLAGEHGHTALLAKIKADVVECAPDLILVTGDLTGQDVPHRATPLERREVVEFILLLAETAPVVICRGNHDPVHEWGFLNYLRGDNTIVYVEDPEFVELDSCGVMILPWLDRSQFEASANYAECVRLSYLEAVNEVQGDIRTCARSKKPVFVLTHAAPAGAMLRDGQPAVPTNDPLLDLTEIKKAGPFEAVFTGHYHYGQEIGERIYGTGSTFVSQYGEDAPKTWLLYDTDERAADAIEIDQPARVRLEIDIERERVAAVAPADACPVKVGTPVTRVSSAFDGAQKSPTRIKLVARYGEDVREKGDALIRRLKDDLDGVVSSVVTDVRVERVVRLREGASEVAAATTLLDKIDAYAALRQVPLAAPTLARAKAVYHELSEAMA